MSELGLEPSALGVARHYGRLVNGWIVDSIDRGLVPAIEALGCRVKISETMMRTFEDKTRLARETLEFAFDLASEPVG
jgi:LPPG:FO 2-phospho-L-lactate transferase